MVLFGIDHVMHARMLGNYWRYVDDIVLVGEGESNRRSAVSEIIADDLELSLHEKKDFAVDAETWL
jgi:hypothetical protein